MKRIAALATNHGTALLVMLFGVLILIQQQRMLMVLESIDSSIPDVQQVEVQNEPLKVEIER